MSSGIFTRKAGELIFKNKIQQSSIDFTRFNIIKRINRSAKEIIIVGIGKVTQWYCLAPSRQAIQHTSRHTSRQAREKIGKERANKTIKVNGEEENERQMENNVSAREMSLYGYLVCLDLREDLPGNGARNPSCYVLSLRWFSLKRKGRCSTVA